MRLRSRGPRAWPALASLSAWALGLASISAVSACILADPPAELPQPRSLRPAILTTEVVPSTARPLLELPPEFVVPIELSDPTRPFEWRVFVDFDPLGNNDLELQPRGSGGGTPDSPDVETVYFSLNNQQLAAGCHRIDFVVASHFDGARAADPALSDTVTWFYAPAGNIDGCSSYDGGAFDASLVDAGND